MIHLSFSQYNIWKTCPFQWKLLYIDKIKIPSASIDLVFGSSLHHVLQEYLDTFYKLTEKKANELDLEKSLLDSMVKEIEEYRKKGIEDFTTPEELIEYYIDGIEIIHWFKKHRADYFSKKNIKMIGYEVPIDIEILPGVKFIAKLDFVTEDKRDNNYVIVDFKKSYRGWGANKKANKMVQAQLQLYKHFFSEVKKIVPANVNILFLIFKQKLYKDSLYPQKRVQKFEPSSGKNTLIKVKNEFMEFAKRVTKDGDYNANIEYSANPSDFNCKYCPFKNKKELCPVGV